jgi:hypothetical protein
MYAHNEPGRVAKKSIFQYNDDDESSKTDAVIIRAR